MNNLNYATLEASKKLVKAGIVLETESVRYLQPDGHWRIAPKHDVGHLWRVLSMDVIPAPSMAEVWRELPENVCDYYPILTIDEEETKAEYRDTLWNRLDNSQHRNTNPTDALINLLIWVKGQVRC